MVRQQRSGLSRPGEDDDEVRSPPPAAECVGSIRDYASKSGEMACQDVNQLKKMYQKALVWSPAPDTHGKPPGLSSSANTGAPVSPSSNLVHWMSMMTEHVPNSPHDVHYLWNGVESKMNTSDLHNASAMHKGPGGSLDEGGRGGGGGGMDSSQMHGIYGANRANSTSSGSPPVSTPSSGGSMLVVPQPISAVTKGPGVPAGVATNGTGRKYQCKMCPQIFGSKADLQLHTQIHMRDAKPYKCSQCSKTFANSSYLSQHTRIHLGIKPYRCEICHRKFTQLSHLQQHIRTHTGDKPYKCRYPNCNKAFSQLSNLQSHSRCHQTDKPYKCNSCYKCFSDEASLLEHIPKHKESKHLKTHICQFCGKSYTQETYLAKHMQKHADRMEKHGLMMSGGNSSGGHVGNHHGHHSLMLGSSMGGPGSQLQPDMLWQKALQAKVVENVVSMGDDGPNSSVAAMAAVAASQRRSMDSCLPSLGSMNSRDMDNRQDSRLTMSCNDQENMGGPQQQQQQQQQQIPPPPSSQSMFDSPMSTTAGMTNSSGGGKSTSSAFTPIQAGLLPMGNQLNIVSSPRTYFAYDSINFGKNVETTKNTTSFPNQLISLRQIKSYASMPTMPTGMDHPISLKGKGPN